ncbi:MAG: exonuclease SbcCD subunit D [Candidatus Methanomethylophilaceae archaeon]|nr:exonuclease SbcCD subunit D [Candidatus Methanomethylophilaceae archaeon]
MAETTKLIHVSDLHLGKTLHGYGLEEDQRHMLGQIVSAIDREGPDGLIIAGDVYDKSVPREDAVTMFSEFLADVQSRCPVYMISGNHDSGRRLDYCDGILRRNGIHIAGSFKGRMDRIVLNDGHGELNLYLLPYVRPSAVRPFFPDSEIEGLDQALAAVLEASGVDPSARNVLVSHQFFIASGKLPDQCDSETSRAHVGGLDCMSAELLEPFDYVALGHIHNAQKVGRETVRYCGSPLKYSLSEAEREKSITIVELAGKGEVSVRTTPIKPLRDLAVLKGTLESVLEESEKRPELKDQYVGVVLTEHAYEPDKRLRAVFDRLLNITFEIEGRKSDFGEIDIDMVKRTDPKELFEEFYGKYTGKGLTDYQRRMLDKAMSEEGYR